MKDSLKKVLGISILSGLLLTAFTGCYEEHYYHTYHHHTHDWYDRHHESVPTGVDFNVDVDVHHHH